MKIAGFLIIKEIFISCERGINVYILRKNVEKYTPNLIIVVTRMHDWFTFTLWFFCSICFFLSQVLYIILQ